MGAAFGWGLLAASSLLLGGLIALRFRVGPRALGLVMAFGAGVLISAVAYELVEEAFSTSEGAGPSHSVSPPGRSRSSRATRPSTASAARSARA